MDEEPTVTWHPAVTCLHPVLIVAPGGRVGRGVIVRLGLEDAVLRTRIPLEPCQTAIMAGEFDDRPARIAITIEQKDADRLVAKFAASDAESRAAIARFVFKRLRKDTAPPQLMPRAKAVVEMSRRRPHVKVRVEAKEVDRHTSLTTKWLDKQLVPPTPPIAPRTG